MKLKLLHVAKGQICPPRLDSFFFKDKLHALKLLANYRKNTTFYWEPPIKFNEDRWAIVEDIAPEFNQYGEVCP